MHRRSLIGAGLGAPFLRSLPAGAQDAPAVSPGRRSHGLALHGTPALPAGFPHWPWVNPDAPKGGEMVRWALGSFDSFNPFVLRGTPGAGLNALQNGILWESLTERSTDEANTAYCHLAAVVEVAADHTWVAFELRTEARWHDGKPVLAEDVTWTFATLMEKGRPLYRAYWGDVAEVKAESARRVLFRFKNGDNHELPSVLGELPVLPKHWWEGRDFGRPTLDLPLGSGPYRLEKFEPGRSITWRRVPDYWGANLGTRKGTQNFDSIRYEYFRDNTVALEAFKAGQVDLRQENIAKEWATGYDFPAVRQGLVKKAELPHQNPMGMQSFTMNLRRPLFADARVRQALGLVFDFEWLNANLFYGSYRRTESFFQNSELASSGLPQGRELAILERYRGRVPEQVFTTPYKEPVTDGSGNNRDNLRRALALLKEAGWEVKERKLVNAQGQQFSFEILLGEPSMERLALPYVQWLQRIGVEARVRTVDPAQYQVRSDAYDYDMTVDVIGQSLSPGNEQREFFSCAKAAEPGGRNTAGICDPVIDELIELVIAAPDREELIQRTRALDRVLLWHHYVIPMYHLAAYRLAWWAKFGRPPRNPKHGLGVEGWWWDPQRAAAVEAGKRTSPPAAR
jgi:microcin C transport system substrate-binding protein